MKVFASNCTFDYSWEEVSTANWRKYCPWNDKSTHVVAVDILSRRVEPQTGIVRTPALKTSFLSRGWLTLLSFIAAHRTSDNLPPVRPAVDLEPVRRQRDVARLRGVLRRPGVEESYHVLDEPDVVERAERQGDRGLRAVAVDARVQDPVHAGRADHGRLQRLAEDQEQDRRSERREVQPECQEGPRGIRGRA